ncbi:hypothetical protein ACFOEE_02605 [Pseudoalteromonas fenneropenaei]|uniref:Lipoprotein n=1 Tax=Pseudoalteromonas fenneropenaei TaxID=1737459 RepID=A0ABV7CFM2_9GAMM
MKHALTFAALLMLVGCGSTSDNQSTQASSDSNMQLAKQNSSEILNTEGYKCDKEVTTGSRFTKKRCRTAEQRKADQQEAKDMLSTRGNAVSQVK